MDLPPYLRTPPEMIEHESIKIDQEILTQCLQLDFPGITRDKLIQVIRNQESSPFRVVYDLTLDHKNAKIRINGAFTIPDAHIPLFLTFILDRITQCT